MASRQQSASLPPHCAIRHTGGREGAQHWLTGPRPRNTTGGLRSTLKTLSPARALLELRPQPLITGTFVPFHSGDLPSFLVWSGLESSRDRRCRTGSHRNGDAISEICRKDSGHLPKSI